MIPEGVTIINSGVFRDKNITNVTFPSTLQRIEASAFENCPFGSNAVVANGASIVIPKSVTYIGKSAFRECTYLKSVEFESGDTVLTFDTQDWGSQGLFESCSNLQSVKLGNRIKKLPYFAFQNCSKLSSVDLGTSLETIDGYAFYQCIALHAIDFPATVETIGNYAFAIEYDESTKAGLTDIVLPDNLQTIGNHAFEYTSLGSSKNLLDLEIPGSVTRVGANAFAGVKFLRSIRFLYGENEMTIGGDAFTKCPELKTLKLPSKLLTIDNCIEDDCPKFTDIYISGNTNSINKLAVRNDNVTVHGVKNSPAYTFYTQNKDRGFKWADYTEKKAVTIAINSAKLEKEYDADYAPLSITDVFTPDANCGAAEYTLLSGNGTLTKAGALTITRGGIFRVKITTSETSTHESGSAVASVIVSVKNPRTVTFDSQGGSAVAPITGIVKGSKISEPDEPSRKGWYFTGWYKDSACTTGNEWDFDHDIVTEDTTLYAKWRDRSQVLKPEANIASGTVEKGTRVILTTNTIDATIVYTVDGSIPNYDEDSDTVTGNQYSDAIVIDEEITIKAIAFKKGLNNSELLTLTYDISDKADAWGDILTEDRTQFDGDSRNVPRGIWATYKPSIEGLSYNGLAKMFDVHVYDHTTRLIEKTDYSISYKNNINAAKSSDKNAKGVSIAPQIIIKGKGVYSGTVVKYFTIAQKNIADHDVIATDICLKTNGKIQHPSVSLTYAGKKLKQGKDFETQYLSGDFTTEGEHTIRVNGIGNYTASREIKVYLVNSAAKPSFKVEKIANETYTGSPITPAVNVTVSGAPLTEDQYSVTYFNNVNVGTAYAVVKVGSECTIVNFKIIGTKITATIVEGIVEKTYNGQPIEQNLIVKDKSTGKVLTEYDAITNQGDYKVTYQKNTDVGKATIIIEGRGGYTGSVKKNFKILAASMNDTNHITVNVGKSAEYAKGGAIPNISVTFKNASGDIQTLQAGKEYTVKYTNNKKLGTGTAVAVIKGKGNFADVSGNHTYSVVKQNLSRLKIIANDVTYSNKAGKFATSFTITDLDGKPLGKSDYDAKTIKYTFAEDFTDPETGKRYFEGKEVPTTIVLPAGTAITMTVSGNNNYEGTTSANYKIVADSIANVKMTIEKQEYTGSQIRPNKADISIKNTSKTNLTDKDYVIVSYGLNKEKGNGTVVVRGKGNYGGVKVIKFSIGTRTFIDKLF